MARRLSPKPLTLVKAVDESEATENSLKGGPFNRGNPDSCYKCSLCETGKCADCERTKGLFCGCYRYKHKIPKDKVVRSIGDGLAMGNVKLSTKKAKPIEDIEWEDVEWEDA